MTWLKGQTKGGKGRIHKEQRQQKHRQRLFKEGKHREQAGIFNINETGTRSIDETALNLEGELQRHCTWVVCVQVVAQRQLLFVAWESSSKHSDQPGG
jgi:hypothetical protein